MRHSLRITKHCLASRDRKSTRLNSSHSQISYAVFCLKKKKSKHEHLTTKTRHSSRVSTRIPPSTLPGRLFDLQAVAVPLPTVYHMHHLNTNLFPYHTV